MAQQSTPVANSNRRNRYKFFDLLWTTVRGEITNLSTKQKVAIVISVDCVLLTVAVWLSCVLVLGEMPVFDRDFIVACFLAPAVTVPALYLLRIYKLVVRYFQDDLWQQVGKAVLIGMLVWYALLYMAQYRLPASVVVLYGLLAFMAIIGSRVIARYIIVSNTRSGEEKKRRFAWSVCIYGAGEAGRSLAAGLATGPEIYVAGFVDDNPSLQGRMINGKLVISADRLDTFGKEKKIDEILLAIPSASRERKLEIVQELESKLFKVRNVPGVSQIALGNIRKAWFQDDYMSQLLGREKSVPDQDLLRECITGRSVLISGAGGSIGSELGRQIVELEPNRLVLFDVSEVALYKIETELIKYIDSRNIQVELVCILGSVLERQHLEQVVKKFGIETFYHAAAYKHVPIVEHNMASGLRNNVLGTLNAAEVAAASTVQNFVLISTDKAVRPTNVMGASKRLAELVVQAVCERARQEGKTTRFSMVRFGNVLGSSGSVIPAFVSQIRMGGPVTLTAAEITRYFMTTQEAASLVLQAGSIGRDGEVFVLDMGEPVKIIDVARRMIEMAGLTAREEGASGVPQDGDIELVITGLRPGEKLYEELLIGDNVGSTEHKQIMKASEAALSREQIQVVLNDLTNAMEVQDSREMVEVLLASVNGYQPTARMVDYLGG